MKWVVEVIAIVCLSAIEVSILLTTQIDGMVASSIIGAIVFIVTRKHYLSSSTSWGDKKTIK